MDRHKINTDDLLQFGNKRRENYIFFLKTKNVSIGVVESS